ncbi:homeobox domain-containing protein, partial [Cokeromyces recurvatus]|uniref:homeobox domain-containing protein n=1 Tax=Cokeromyces recurvatus TaxID=90255 RepID=UPI00221FA110
TSTSRKRTRATPEQLEILEKTFTINPSPNNRIREQLSHELGMSERSIQIWFQNRRAKVKNEAKKNTLLHDETLKMQYYASTAAIAACQAAVFYQQERNNELKIVEDPIKSNPNLYYYYYYYYFNQQQSR